VFVLLAHYKGRIDRDTCNVYVSRTASYRTAAIPSTSRYGKSEYGYHKFGIIAKDRYPFHIVLSGHRAHCSGEESGTTDQEADLNAAMLSPTALPRDRYRLALLEVYRYMIAVVTLRCAVRPSPNNSRTSTKCPDNPLPNLIPIHATTSQQHPQDLQHPKATTHYHDGRPHR
jgi:hypothetical protein